MTTVEKSRRVKVLYLHGFEETWTSPKPSMLRNDPEIDLIYCDTYIYPNRQNGFILGMVQNKRILGTLGASMVIAYFSFALVGLAVLSGAFYYQKREITYEVVKRSVEQSYQIALNKLHQTKPDVVVGFSWGGCLATMMLKSRAWEGPTVLLAPAYENILPYLEDLTIRGTAVVLGKRYEYKEPVFLDHPQREELESLVKVAVGLQDAIVKPADIEKFCERNNFYLYKIENETHKLWAFTELPQVVKELYK